METEQQDVQSKSIPDEIQMPRVKVSAAEEMLFGAHAPIVRKLGEAAQALAEARQIANVYLNESIRIDEWTPVHERKPVVTDRTRAFDDANRNQHGGPAWVQMAGDHDKGDDVNVGWVASENSAFWSETFAFLWKLEGPVEEAHRGVAMEGGARNDRERRRYDSRPTPRGHVEITGTAA